MNLAGGTFAKGNFAEGSASSVGLRALTLTASGSRIHFGAGTVGVLTLCQLYSWHEYPQHHWITRPESICGRRPDPNLNSKILFSGGYYRES